MGTVKVANVPYENDEFVLEFDDPRMETILNNHKCTLDKDKTADKMITLAKRGDLASRRQAAAFLRNVVADVKEDGDNVRVQSALQYLFEELAPKFADRKGGYTRILKTMPRRGDGAQMVVLEFVD